jgi:ribosomal protein L28
MTPRVKLRRCAICGKLALTTLVLTMTANGFRRVHVCANCARLGGKIVTK